MTVAVAVLAFVAVLNPPRTRLGVPDDSGRVARVRRLAFGVAVAGAALVALGAGADALFDSLDISPETFRIAAGFVVVVIAVRMLLVAIPNPEPEPSAPWARLVWPIAFPRVLSPEVIALTLTVAASDGLNRVVVGLGVAGLSLLGLGALSLDVTGRRATAALGRIVAVVAMLVGVWLALQGIREV